MPEQNPTSLRELNKRDMLLRSELARYGHTLGLAITYQNPTTGHVLSSEGLFNSHSMGILSELLNQYLSETDDEYMEKVADIIKKQSIMENSNVLLANAINNFDIPGIFKASYRRYVKSLNEKNKQRVHGICVIPIESEEHGFYMAYNDKNISISNRGQSHSVHKFGVRTFKLKQDSLSKIDEMRIDKMRQGSMEEIEKKFTELAEKEPVLSFEFKYQKIGNCTFANIKSLIKPILYMLGDTKDYQARYKDFTTWVREYEIKQVIQKYKLAQSAQDPELTAVYEKILVAYINRNCLVQTILTKTFENSVNMGYKFIATVLGRGEANFKSSDITKIRRHANIAMIYKELKDDTKFKEAFETIVNHLNNLDYKEAVTETYTAKLPKESSVQVPIATEELPSLGFKAVILFPILVLAQIGAFFAANLNAFIEERKETKVKNNPKLVANPNGNPLVTSRKNDTTLNDSPYYERKRRTHVFSKDTGNLAPQQHASQDPTIRHKNKNTRNF